MLPAGSRDQPGCAEREATGTRSQSEEGAGEVISESNGMDAPARYGIFVPESRITIRLH
jgi:hypothetical protein